jgi:glutathione peroxidase
MKLFTTYSFIALLNIFIWQESIYNYNVSRIEGGNQSMAAYQGKKILIITLPVQYDAAADTLLYCLDTLASAHSLQLAVIAIPAYEDGFTPALKEQLNQWYRSRLGNYIVITDGLYTRKTSGTQQHPLFKWLTTDTLNDVFNIDVEGPGHKFFVNTTGQLYGVLRPQTKISSNVVYKTLQAE